LERSRGELLLLEVLREGRAVELLRPWARRLALAESESWSLMRSSDFLSRSSDLLRSLLCPDGVALESDEVVLFALSLSRSEDVLSPFIFELSDLLSVAVLDEEELGVEVELVSWLCARALGAASARARTDNATNIIENLRGLLV